MQSLLHLHLFGKGKSKNVEPEVPIPCEVGMEFASIASSLEGGGAFVGQGMPPLYINSNLQGHSQQQQYVQQL